ncbi:Degradation activator [Leclercia adecarboxylata]|uniref:Degradation activator n=1 Tax=Leclercia adecarboxylata TaxID=83655 RepID=A0A4U9HSH9_9ENTR|nr:Degradation activator [Leclercia adecarboxylata]
MAVAKKITINDVAQAAGVSVSTVSLVLSGKGRISSATGQRVNDAVEQLGFVRNRQASALRGGQSGVIGLIVRDLTSAVLCRTDGRADGGAGIARPDGLFYSTVAGKRINCSSGLDMLLTQGVDGVIVAGASGLSNELCERAAQKGVPLVFASRASYLDGGRYPAPGQHAGSTNADRTSYSPRPSADCLAGRKKLVADPRRTGGRLLFNAD